jgi:hypothetical protein
MPRLIPVLALLLLAMAGPTLAFDGPAIAPRDEREQGFPFIGQRTLVTLRYGYDFPGQDWNQAAREQFQVVRPLLRDRADLVRRSLFHPSPDDLELARALAQAPDENAPTRMILTFVTSWQDQPTTDALIQVRKMMRHDAQRPWAGHIEQFSAYQFCLYVAMTTGNLEGIPLPEGFELYLPGLTTLLDDDEVARIRQDVLEIALGSTDMMWHWRFPMIAYLNQTGDVAFLKELLDLERQGYRLSLRTNPDERTISDAVLSLLENFRVATPEVIALGRELCDHTRLGNSPQPGGPASAGRVQAFLFAHSDHPAIRGHVRDLLDPGLRAPLGPVHERFLLPILGESFSGPTPPSEPNDRRLIDSLKRSHERRLDALNAIDERYPTRTINPR